MDIRQTLRQYIQDNFMMGLSSQAIGDDDSLLDNNVIDSTGVLELIAFLEEKFQIKVEDAELLPENLDSISALAGFVHRKQAILREA